MKSATFPPAVEHCPLCVCWCCWITWHDLYYIYYCILLYFKSQQFHSLYLDKIKGKMWLCAHFVFPEGNWWHIRVDLLPRQTHTHTHWPCWSVNQLNDVESEFLQKLVCHLHTGKSAGTWNTSVVTCYVMYHNSSISLKLTKATKNGCPFLMKWCIQIKLWHTSRFVSACVELLRSSLMIEMNVNKWPNSFFHPTVTTRCTTTSLTQYLDLQVADTLNKDQTETTWQTSVKLFYTHRCDFLFLLIF